MLQIRQGVFETNSSSTHTVSICSAEVWDDLKKGKVLIDRYLNILTIDEANEANQKLREEAIARGWDPDEYIEENGYVTYDELYDEYEYEWFNSSAEINGVNVVAFGYYGYDY